MTGEAIPSEIPWRQRADAEADLIRRAKANSPEAWAEIYDRYHGRLFRYVAARVDDWETAEDLTATVFLEAFKSIRSYVSRGRPLLAWLYRIARNVVNYHYRSTWRKGEAGGAARILSHLLGPRPGEERPLEGLPPTNEAGDLGDATSVVERWDLRQAIDKLSADQREVIILRYFVGLNTPEVASVLGKHERAVYSLQARAIKALRRYLR